MRILNIKVEFADCIFDGKSGKDSEVCLMSEIPLPVVEKISKHLIALVKRRKTIEGKLKGKK